MHGIRSGTVALLALALLPSSAGAAEPYEGAWARTQKDCKGSDGATSLTVIDLKVNVDGRPTPMLEQYENHCLINSKSTTGSDTTLSVTCFEFWDDFKKRTDGRNATIKLSVASRELLKIGGKQYRRCPASSKAGKR